MKEWTMGVRRLVIAALVSLLLAGLGWSQADQKKTEKKEKAQEKQKAEEKEETKLFQLDEIVIDVIEKIRDVEIPNMTVVKPELYPMSIGTTLDTALERQPGVDIQRIQEVGTAMDDDSVKIRGLSGRRIKVLRDGRLLNTSGAAGGYFIDFTMIPLTDVDRVEIVKGVGDPRYGNSLGGIINLIPRRLPTESPFTEAELSTASFGTYGVNVYHAFKPGAFEYSISGRLTRSDGYLRNGNMNFGYFNVHLGYDLPFQGRLTAGLSFSRIKKGFIVSNRISKDPDDPEYEAASNSDFPSSDGEYMYGGMGAYPEPGSWWDKDKWLFELGYEQGIGKNGVLSVSYWRNYGNREAYNTRAAIDRVFHKVFYDDRSQGFRASYNRVFSGYALTAGLDYDNLSDDGDANEPDDFRAPFRNGNYVTVRNLGVYALTDVSVWRDKLIVTPGVRFMSYNGISGPSGKLELIPDIRMSGWAPSLKITYAYTAENLLYFSLARALRMPTAPEHYWHYDPDDAGVNTSGLPFHNEDGIMLQGGWRVFFPSRTKFEISPYYYRIKNYIQFDLINFVSYNIDDARIYGLEAEVAQQFGGGWSSFLNYCYQRSQTEGDVFISLFVDPRDADFAEIPGLPAHKFNAGIRFRTRRNLSLGLFLQAVSKQNVIYNNNTLYNTQMRVRTQAAYARMDVELRYPVISNLEVSAFIRNLFDANYQERFGFPVAGRSFGISLKSRI
jgi:outer membrane receptor protein involved in Fe transport